MKSKQLDLFFKKKTYGITKSGLAKKKPGRKCGRPPTTFGGSYFKSYNPAMKRPLNSKKALHLVMRSSLARGRRSFLNKEFDGPIWDIILKHAKKNNIRIYEYANGGNHLHILLRAKTRDEYKRFIRAVTGLIARLVSGVEKGSTLGRKFWDGRPFTRIVSFGKRDFENVKSYITRNTLEAIGWLPYFSRSQIMPAKWKTFWKSMLVVPLE